MDARRPARGRRRARPRRARERRHRRLARRDPRSPTTGSTTAATRSCGTASARRCRELAPGERATVDARVRAPIPPGRYRFALDLVAEHRAWFSELGSETAAADVDVLPRAGDAPGRAARPGSSRRPEAARAHRGRARRGLRGRRRRDRVGRRLRPAAPAGARAVRAGPGPDPELRASAALPVGARRARARAARGRRRGCRRSPRPADEAWLYDGRIVLRAHPKRRGGAD